MEQLNKLKLLWRTGAEAPSLLLRKGLVRWIWAPVVLNAILLSGVIWASFVLSEIAVQWVENTAGADFIPTWVSWAFAFVLRFVLVMLYFTIYKQVVLVVLAPLLALLGEALDSRLSGREFPFSVRQLIKDSWRGVRLAVRNLITELLLTAVLVGFAFVPIVGLISPLMIFLLQAYFVGFSLLDYGLERDKLGVAESKRYLKDRKLLCVGVGLYHNGLFLLPLVGWIFAPVLGMAMATKIYLIDRSIIPAE